MSTALTARDWRDLAACRGFDPELFFPIGTSGPAATQIEEAKQVCAICPVREACLDWALRRREGYGIYGGMTENERRTAVGAAPRISVLCGSGRHLKTGPGSCPVCKREREREREKTRVRDQAAVYAGRVARAREARELVA